MNPDSSIQAKCFHPTGTFIEFKKEEIEQSIPQRFEEQVARFPDRSAIKSRKHHFTYNELSKASNRVAQAILSRRGPGQEPVALLMEHDAPVIAAILGVLKVGAIYVPLDPSLPHSRARFILENSQASHIVTNTNNLSLAKSLAGTVNHLINIDELDDLSDENPCIDVKPDDLSWIIYTSGSTGNPKGIIHVHRNVLHFIMNHTNGLHISSHDRLTLLYSFSVKVGPMIFSARY
ncbi:MAG: AMP-binding protein [Candidatus Binatia bacterium]